MISYKKQNRKRIKVFVTFIFIFLIFIQVSISNVRGDDTEDGLLKINSGDWINIANGTYTVLTWQFQVNTNNRAIYWEILGYDNFFKDGWGPTANCTTPTLNSTEETYKFECHGYYAKYHVWSTYLVTCTATGQPNGNGGENEELDSEIFLYIGIPIVILSVIGSLIYYVRRKRRQDFY